MSKHALYLMFNGNCKQALDFYKEKLEGNIEFIQTYGDSPMETTEAQKDKVMHATLDLQGFKIMASDTDGKANVNMGDNFSVALDFKSDGELERAFSEMSTGGQVTMPLQDTFWGAKFGMCTDKFGVNWMFNYDKPKEN
jgi:PhnB protein